MPRRPCRPEPRLAVAQKAGNKRLTRALHAKIANRGKAFQHQLSPALVGQHGAVFVGDVNAKALSQTPAAKSLLDAGWSRSLPHQGRREPVNLL